MLSDVKYDIEAQIIKLHEQTKSYVREIRKLVEVPHHLNQISITSYFTYSVNISHVVGQESLCLGSYHIHNTGYLPITNPSICIKFPKESPFSFSGRYVYENLKQSLKKPGEWERINEKANSEEIWLKPLGKNLIEPNEKISYSNFQIKWTPTKSYGGSIMGFTYSDQTTDGISVLNPINLNGTIWTPQEDDDE